MPYIEALSGIHFINLIFLWIVVHLTLSPSFDPSVYNGEWSENVFWQQVVFVEDRIGFCFWIFSFSNIFGCLIIQGGNVDLMDMCYVYLNFIEGIFHIQTVWLNIFFFVEKSHILWVEDAFLNWILTGMMQV